MSQHHSLLCIVAWVSLSLLFLCHNLYGVWVSALVTWLSVSLLRVLVEVCCPLIPSLAKQQ